MKLLVKVVFGGVAVGLFYVVSRKANAPIDIGVYLTICAVYAMFITQEILMTCHSSEASN